MNTTEQRFREKVAPPNVGGCQLWTAHTDRDGYGQLWAGGRQVKAHRFAWELAHGPIPDGLCVLHRCDTPGCVNPAHLFLGTRADNHADMDAKGRGVLPDRRGSKNGRAKLNEAGVAEIFLASGTRSAIAARHGISSMQVRRIKRREHWALVTEGLSP